MWLFFKQFKYLAITLGFLSIISISLFYRALKPAPTLPVYQPAMVNAELVDTAVQYVRKYHTIANFSLLNQNGDTITQEDYRGKIYIADFFFTTCASICPVMTDNMRKIQQRILHDEEVMLLSHSVTPRIDSVAQLKKYARAKGVNDRKWNLVTGDKKQIYELARKSYLAVKDDGNGDEYDMIHTENFILVDKERRIRGFYDGTDEKAMKKLLADVKILQAGYQH